MRVFISVIAVSALLTLFFSIVSYFSIVLDSSFSQTRICFNTECVKNFEKIFEGPIKILSFGMSFISFFAVVSGVMIALKTYLASVRSSALTGHVSHLTMFKNYLNDEIEKYDLLRKQNIDIFKWYHVAFPDSSKGIVQESNCYMDFIKNISDNIIETNEKINSPKGEFGYKDHQSRVIDSLLKIGINLSFLPKNNFHEVEREIFCLIDSVNQTFTDISIKLCDLDRSYT